LKSRKLINKQRALTLEDKNEWQDVRTLIVDEVSFMSDKNLITLDRKLKDIGNRNKPFGGFSIIFAGDFRQLEPVGTTESDLIFSSSSTSSNHWINCINVIIILDNAHRFTADQEYGQMQHTLQCLAMRCLKQTQSSLKQISQALRQRNPT
jgi:hypothetical protein